MRSWLATILLTVLLAGCSQPATEPEVNPESTATSQPATPMSKDATEITPPTFDASAPLLPSEDAEPADIKALPQALLVSPLVMQEFLEQNIGVAGFGGKVFCAYETLTSQENEAGGAEEYLWTLCQEYYKVGQDLMKGTGVSVPVAIFLKRKGDNYQIASFFLPGDGEDYAKGIQGVFPPEIWPLIFPTDQVGRNSYNQRAQRLEDVAERRAMAYFKANP